MYSKIELIYKKKTENMTWIVIAAIKSGLHTISFAAGYVHVCMSQEDHTYIICLETFM